MLSLTGAFRSDLNRTQGQYAGAGIALTDKTDLWIGASFSEYNGLEQNSPLIDLTADTPVTSTAARLNHYESWGSFGLEAGFMQEERAILGARATDAFAITDKAETIWLSASASLPLANDTFFHITATGGRTNAGQTEASVFNDINTLISSRFSAGFIKSATFFDKDQFAFTINQPLRIERGSVGILANAGRDAETANLLFTSNRFGLSPSGREIAVEGAYRAQVGLWTMEANIAFRMDANHVKGQQDALLFLGIYRPF